MPAATAPCHIAAEQDYVVNFSDITVNLDRREVMRRGRRVDLTAPEYQLLTLLIQNAGRDLSRDTILESVWGSLSASNRTVDAYILRLRQKLEPDPNAPRHFVTLHKVGYRFDPAP